MDYGTAIAIAVPASTFIVSVAVIVVKANNKSGSLNSTYVRKGECDTRVQSFKDAMVSTKDELLRGINGLDTKFENLRKALGK